MKTNRWRQYEEQWQRPPTLPPLADGEYLFNAFLELDKTEVVDGVERPISWREIHAYRECGGVISTVWECTMLRKMSHAYLEGLRAGNDIFGEPPTEHEEG